MEGLLNTVLLAEFGKLAYKEAGAYIMIAVPCGARGYPELSGGAQESSLGIKWPKIF